MAPLLASTGVVPAAARVEFPAEETAVAAASSVTPCTEATPPQADGIAIGSPSLDVARSNTDKNKNKRKEPATPRGRNWSPGECAGLLSAVTSDWAALRAARTTESKKAMGEKLLRAFVLATPVKDRALARTRDIDQVERKIKGLRSKYVETRKALAQTGGSTAKREDALIKFGGAVLYDMARSAFKNSAVSNEQTVHEPELFGAGPAAAILAAKGGRSAAQVAAVAVGDQSADVNDSNSKDSNNCNDTVKAVDLLAAEEEKKDAKITKKETAAGVLRDYIKQKMEQDKAAIGRGRAGQAGRCAGDGEATSAVTDHDIRSGVVEMIQAFTEKARRE